MTSVKKQIDASWPTLNNIDRKINCRCGANIVNLVYEETDEKLILIIRNLWDTVHNESGWLIKK
jgi:hypothetical protein